MDAYQFYDPSYYFIKDSRYGRKEVSTTFYAWYDNTLKMYHVFDKRKDRDYYMYYKNTKPQILENPKTYKKLKHMEDCGYDTYLIGRFGKIEQCEREFTM